MRERGRLTRMWMWVGESCEGQGGFGPFLKGLEWGEGQDDARRLDWCLTC